MFPPSNDRRSVSDLPAETGASDRFFILPEKGSILTDAGAMRTARALPSVFVSILIAFFPKCPLCWAAYMTMFGSAGLARTPYIGWLFPVLIALLSLHLLLLLQKARKKGYGPFICSVTGALIILGSRAFLPSNQFVMIPGVLLILSGSLWNSFSFRHYKTSF